MGEMLKLQFPTELWEIRRPTKNYSSKMIYCQKPLQLGVMYSQKVLKNTESPILNEISKSKHNIKKIVSILPVPMKYGMEPSPN